MKKTLMLSTAAIALMLALPAAYSQDRTGAGNDPQRAPATHSQRNAQPERSGKAQRSTTGQATSGQATGSGTPNADRTREPAAARSESGARSDGNRAREQTSPAANQNAQSPSDRQRAQAPQNTQRHRQDAQDNSRQRSPSQARQGNESPDHSRNAERNHEKSPSSSHDRAQRNDRNDRNANAHPQADHQRASDNARDRSHADRRNSDHVNVKITERERTRISTAVSRLHVRPLTNVNFRVSVGVVIPASVRFRPLPAEIVAIVPQYRGYDFVLVRDQIVIIEPRTRKIVEVMPYSGGARTAHTSTQSHGRVSLSDEQRRTVRRTVVTHETTAVAPASEIAIGEELPDTVVVREFPQTVYESAPALRSYRYVVRDQDVYLVDPGSRRVIEEIR
jgi:hypothetical protein